MRCFDRCIEVSLCLSLSISLCAVFNVCSKFSESSRLVCSAARSAALLLLTRKGTLCGQCANASASLPTSSAATINHHLTSDRRRPRVSDPTTY